MKQYLELSFVMATNNLHKLKEVQDILPGIMISSLSDEGIEVEVEETSDQFIENALIKARAVSALTDKAVLADDSGLCVDYLGGAPGVYSARYAGRHGDDSANNALLLKNLENASEWERGAKFVCAAACRLPGGREFTQIGEVYGRVAFDIKGNRGFGYDSVFIEASTGIRFSEMTMGEKSALSHRMKAFASLFRLMGIGNGC